MLVTLPAPLGAAPCSVRAHSDPGALLRAPHVPLGTRTGTQHVPLGTGDANRGGSWPRWWRGSAATCGTSSPLFAGVPGVGKD